MLHGREILRPSRPPKGVLVLRDASRALWYEIWMLHAMVRSLAVQVRTPRDVSHNALVESFALHTRNLIEFLYPTDTVDPDTIIAADFLADWKEDMPEWLRIVKKRTNKLLAHLTYDRVSNSTGSNRWDVRKIGNHLNAALGEFFRRVPRDRIGDKLWNYWTDVGTRLRY
jgi:hypothetical protein